MDNTALVTFRDGTLDLDVAVSSTENTVWLSLDQISKLFEKCIQRYFSYRLPEIEGIIKTRQFG